MGALRLYAGRRPESVAFVEHMQRDVFNELLLGGRRFSLTGDDARRRQEYLCRADHLDRRMGSALHKYPISRSN
jgi:hypothetical protein